MSLPLTTHRLQDVRRLGAMLAVAVIIPFFGIAFFIDDAIQPGRLPVYLISVLIGTTSFLILLFVPLSETGWCVLGIIGILGLTLAAVSMADPRVEIAALFATSGIPAMSALVGRNRIAVLHVVVALAAVWTVVGFINTTPGNDVLVAGIFLVVTTVPVFAVTSLRRTLELSIAQVTVASQTDQLTQINNRYGFYQRAERLIRSTMRGDQWSLALFVIDIDHFKAVNDEFGHLEGDRVLIEVARSLSRTDLPHLTLGRFGGEEFLALCTLDESLTVNQAAEALRRGVTSAPRVTVSVGGAVATFGQDYSAGRSPADPPALFDLLVTSADEQLRKAKAAGRDCVRTTVLDDTMPLG